MFFNDWLSRRLLYTPDRVAVVDDADGRHYTYAELDDGHLDWLVFYNSGWAFCPAIEWPACQTIGSNTSICTLHAAKSGRCWCR